MLNQDINSRFQDWLLSPSEALDFEVKGWLDLKNVEAKAGVAKALIALENHGGGLLLIGYTKGPAGLLVPDTPRPPSLAPFNTDAFNAIVKRYAEPAFHVDSALLVHPKTGESFPVAVAHGTSKVPVRAERDSPGNTVRRNFYYIRRPGPASEPPDSGAEWDALIRRCVANQREEIIALLRAFLPSGPAQATTTPRPGERDKLLQFVTNSDARWLALNSSLPDGYPAKIAHGHYSFAARIVGTSRNLTPKSVLTAIEPVRRYTGWPIFVLMPEKETKPKLVDGCIEAWLAKVAYPDVGHADYWRVCPDGTFFLLRGYQEDSEAPNRTMGTPGTLFEATLPIWRLGEFLLRVIEIGAQMFESDFGVLVECEWTGLKGRKLFVHHGRRYVPGYVCEQETVETSGASPQAKIRDLLPEVVRELTLPLYQQFEFLELPLEMYAEELDMMLKGKMV